MIETVENPRIERNPDGYYYLSVEVNGRPAYVDYAQALLRFGIVILSGDGWKGAAWEDFEDELAILPADPDDGRTEPQIVRYGTTDHRLLQLAADFRAIMDTFEEVKTGPLYK